MSKMNRLWFSLQLIMLSLLSSNNVSAADLSANRQITLQEQHGATIFIQRCMLCHGSQGMGEGRIPLKIKPYPNTNIMQSDKAVSVSQIKQIVLDGGTLMDVDHYMPPYKDELNDTEVDNVVAFVASLRKQPRVFLDLLASQQNSQLLNNEQGKTIYETRCVLCHGVDADGQGRMAKIIKSPPPYNLRKSTMPKGYLTQIITLGGEPIGRSAQMPPWGDQLSTSEIESVVDYIMGLRK